MSYFRLGRPSGGLLLGSALASGLADTSALGDASGLADTSALGDASGLADTVALGESLGAWLFELALSEQAVNRIPIAIDSKSKMERFFIIRFSPLGESPRC
jgi:hypothetical protein